ncbi:hypothetical protein BJV77DRAFT_759839 [Russula vinacea]|nr:hypothetical protein BJV77DRAFT_759839 [Russula vinacea]
MSRTRWAIDGPDGTSLELEGRKFRQMTTAPLCFVIWCAHRWGDMSILTTVVVTLR